MIIDGKAIAQKILAEVKVEAEKHSPMPGLAVVRVGENPASVVYVNRKEKACQEAGFFSKKIVLAEDVREANLLEVIGQLNNDPAIHGILVQLPLPRHIDAQAVLEAICPHKDVDGFHPFSVGRLWQGLPGFVAATPKGVVRLLAESKIQLAGRHAVIVGRSNIVGKPLAALLLAQDCTVTICHSRTPDLAQYTRQADILIAAVGRPKLITQEMVKPGAVVIDVGINRVKEGGRERLVGDVDFDNVKGVASAITPVPGGVGPMTIAMLLENTLLAARRAVDNANSAK